MNSIDMEHERDSSVSKLQIDRLDQESLWRLKGFSLNGMVQVMLKTKEDHAVYSDIFGILYLNRPGDWLRELFRHEQSV